MYRYVINEEEERDFNPCFLGFQHIVTDAILKIDNISILVFLDFNWLNMLLRHFEDPDFNPCFLGFQRFVR